MPELDPVFVFVVVLVVVVLVAVLSGRGRGRGWAQRICKSCGASHPVYARFCRRCGQRL